jgi:hypothetical protein
VSRGRYSLGMYTQMNHMDLVVNNASAYVNMVHRLVTDETFWKQQSDSIASKFKTEIHKNHLVAREWGDFLKTSIRSTVIY